MSGANLSQQQSIETSNESASENEISETPGQLPSTQREVQVTPGFISAQLHRGVAGSSTFINYAVWESTSQFKQALSNPQFQAKMSDYPASVMASPHLFKKIAVPGICVS
jgi:heme-degrading monooxygenase HmoA